VQGFYKGYGKKKHQDRGDLMDLDAIYRKKPFKKQNKTAPNKKNKDFNCYNCGKPGHYSKDCKQSRKEKREFNMMDKEDNEGWESEETLEEAQPVIAYIREQLLPHGSVAWEQCEFLRCPIYEHNLRTGKA